jgi:SAM-dependent methyltransferase
MASNFTATDAAGYDLIMGRWSRLLASTFLDFVGIETATQVLDVGCGTGSLTRAVLERSRAEVVGIDLAAPYLAHARRQIDDPRASFEVQDASALPYPAGSFDAALSILVLNFIPEYRAAAAEMARVTRPGGRIGAACWSVEGGSLMMRMFWDTAAALDPGAVAARGRTLSAPLTRPGELAQLFRDRGVHAVEETDLTVWMRFAEFEDFWTPFTTGQGTPGAYVSALDDARKERLRTALRDAYCAGREDGPRAYAAIAHAVRGTVA